MSESCVVYTSSGRPDGLRFLECERDREGRAGAHDCVDGGALPAELAQSGACEHRGSVRQTLGCGKALGHWRRIAVDENSLGDDRIPLTFPLPAQAHAS